MSILHGSCVHIEFQDADGIGFSVIEWKSSGHNNSDDGLVILILPQGES